MNVFLKLSTSLPSWTAWLSWLLALSQLKSDVQVATDRVSSLKVVKDALERELADLEGVANVTAGVDVDGAADGGDNGGATADAVTEGVVGAASAVETEQQKLFALQQVRFCVALQLHPNKRVFFFHFHNNLTCTEWERSKRELEELHFGLRFVVCIDRMGTPPHQKKKKTLDCVAYVFFFSFFFLFFFFFFFLPLLSATRNA